MRFVCSTVSAAESGACGCEVAVLELTPGDARTLLANRSLFAAVRKDNDALICLSFLDYRVAYYDADTLPERWLGDRDYEDLADRDDWLDVADRSTASSPPPAADVHTPTLAVFSDGVAWSAYYAGTQDPLETRVLPWAVLDRVAAGT